MRSVLLFGGAGQVGLSLRRLGDRLDFETCAPDRNQCDLTDCGAIRDVILSRAWAAVINCAAYTAVDNAETDVEQAWRINALAPAVMAKTSAEIGAPIVHVSTDYVFSGELSRAYEEHDAVGPINVYGASKEAAEQAVRTANPRHAIIRTSWVVSADRSNFIKTMLNAARSRDLLRVVHDQKGSPTSAQDLARAIAKVTSRLIDDPDAPRGTFHFTNEGVTTWAEFAEEIFRLSAARGGPVARVDRIASAEYPTRAKRPQNSVLAAGRLPLAYGVERRSWQNAVAEIVRALV